MKFATLTQLLEDRLQKKPVALVSSLQKNVQTLVYTDSFAGELVLTSEQLHEARLLLQSGRSGLLVVNEGDSEGDESASRLFVRSYMPQARLFIIGAVHIAQALAPMAVLAGFDVTVIDPRRAFCQQERFVNTTLNNDWPDEVLLAANIDSQSAIVTLAHDPKIDDPALMVALRSSAFYIGSLGSKRTHAKRLERLTAQGFSDQLHRIHAPIGLNLGGRAHAEIAVSILAQILQERYKNSIVAGIKP